MKIQCDVCNEEEASVFCSADEAALCEGCDRQVHHANKLARKHARFSLLHTSSKDSPLCDICQERRALLFCQQHRDLFCKECDNQIHKVNEHTQRHSRFLLTGVKLSVSSTAFQTSSSSSSVSNNTGSSKISAQAESKNGPPSNKDPVNFWANATEIASESTLNRSTGEPESNSCTNQQGSVSTSTISEFLMETLPGWHVDDFLDPSCFPYGGYKAHDQNLPPFIRDQFQSTYGYFSPMTDSALSVPQAPVLFQAKGVNGSNGYEDFYP